MVGRVKVAGRILALLLAVIWLPASSHCLLESLTGLAMLACGSPHEDASHSSDACEGDGCAVVEGGLYKLERSSGTVPTPEFVELWLTTVSTLPREETTPQALIDFDPSPPPVWQLFQRKALPPRAPGFIS